MADVPLQDFSHLTAHDQVSAAQRSTSPGRHFSGFFGRIIKIFVTTSANQLIVPAAIVHNCIHHRKDYDWRSSGAHSQIGLVLFQLLISERFRKVNILCAIILAFLPTIEIPTSVAAPCFLSFALELFCYTVLSLRVCAEFVWHASKLNASHSFCSFYLLVISLALCWVDVIICMSLLSLNGGEWLSWSNCGMPDPDRGSRFKLWIYLVCRFSRFLRPVIFTDWNQRSRYLMRSMYGILGKLLHILFVLVAIIVLFAALGFIFWSDPIVDISAIPDRFWYFRSFASSIVTLIVLTTTSDFPDCMLDYVSHHFANFAFFLIFIMFCNFFALPLLLSTVYDACQQRLKSYYNRRRIRDRAALARAFQYLCDGSQLLSRQRWRSFMRIYNSLNNLDPSSASNQNRLLRNDICADFMFSMCCIKRRFIDTAQYKTFHSTSFLESMKDSSSSGSMQEGLISTNTKNGGRVTGNSLEPDLLQCISEIISRPASFSDFVELCSLIRFSITVKGNAGFSLFKTTNWQEISLADTIARMSSTEDAASLPLSPHSSSYVCHTPLHQPAEGPPHDTAQRMSAIDIPKETFARKLSELPADFAVSSLIPVRQQAESSRRIFLRKIHGNAFVRLLVCILIICQFAICLVHLEAVNAEKLCKLYKGTGDLWLTCETHKWVQNAGLRDTETAFNWSHLMISVILLLEMCLGWRLQGSKYFIHTTGGYSMVNIAHAVMQLVILLRDLVEVSYKVSDIGSVYRPDFTFFSVLRLLRLFQLRSMLSTASAIFSLLSKIIPILKAFFWIAYLVFFFFGILGMSFFSYTVSNNGIALYPNKSQYQAFYNSEFFSSQYPNHYSPGNHNCNSSDVFGHPGECGQAGPQSPLPFWSASDSGAGAAHDDAYFLISTGSEARAGGCYNFVGETNERVLPCYCYFNSAKMNRTTSCDWINAQWYQTDVGKVLALFTRFLTLSLTITLERLLDT